MLDRSERDALSDVLEHFRLRAEVYKHDDYCGAWQINTSGSQRVAFHLVGRGSCWLHLEGDGDPVPLRAGDLVLFPRDAWHVLSGDPAPPGPPEVGTPDSATDPGEATNVYSKHPKIVAELKALLEESKKSGRSAPPRKGG